MGSFSFVHWLIVGFLAWVAYRVFMSRVPRANVRTQRAAGATVDVVGESFYRPNFERIFPRGKSENDDEVEASATLKLDDGNIHDDQAVAVLIQGLQVGHLSRDDARRYRLTKGADRRDAFVAATVWLPGDPEHHYSVTLHLKL